MTVGRGMGLERESVAKYSFLLSTPIVAAAAKELGILTIGVVVGLILALTLPDIQWLGWTILGVCGVADVGVYIYFTKKREKKLSTLNKQ